MANIRKSFNFRSGVQVDNDRLIVDGRGNVGIGTSIPNRNLDIFGSTRINGLLESSNINVSGVSTFTNDVKVGSGITFGATSGIITAISFRGDGSQLSGIVAIATAGWISNAGTLSTSFSIGIGTTNPGASLHVTPTSTSIAGLFSGSTFGDMVHITQTGGGNAFVVEDEDNPDATPFVVAANGNVGVGTNVTSLLYKLRVHGSGNTIFQITNDTEGVGDNKGLSFGYETTFNRQSIASATLPLVLQTTLNNTHVILQGTNTTRRVGVGSTSPNTKFDVNGSAYISGNLGIGTTNPQYKLQIGGNPLTSSGVAISSEGNILATGVSTIGTLGVTGLTTTQNLQVTGVSTIGTLGVTGLTTTQNLQVTGVSTLGIVSTGNIFSAGIVTATSFVGSLTGTASTALGLSGIPNINVGLLTATTANATTLFVSGNALSALSNGNVGVGTTNPTKDLQVKKSGAVAFEVLSDTSTSTIAIGKSTNLGNNSAAFIYDSGLLKINNYDLGGVEFNLHEGTGTGTTDGFRVKYNSSTLLDLTYAGRLGVNASSPDYNLQVNGTAYISGDTQVVGILTIGTGGSKIVLDPIGGNSIIPFPTSQNFNTVSGLSTFNNLKTTGYVEVGLGVTVKQDSIFEKRVAINTSTFSVIDPSNTYKLIVSGGTRSTGDISLSGRLGISSDGTFYTDPRIIPNVAPFSNDVPYFSYGDVQMVTQGGASVVTQNIILVPQIGVATVGFGTTNGGLKPGGSFDTNNYLTTIGINTYFARGILDVGTASTTMNSYFIPPSLTQSELDIVSTLWNSPTRTGYATARRVTPNGVPPGALVHNKTTNTVQVGYGTNSFRNLSPVVAFATVDAGSLVSSDSYNLSLSLAGGVADFTFSTALPSANYSVVVSYGNTAQSYTVPEGNKLTTGFKVLFTGGTTPIVPYSVMILQI